MKIVGFQSILSKQYVYTETEMIINETEIWEH